MFPGWPIIAGGFLDPADVATNKKAATVEGCIAAKHGTGSWDITIDDFDGARDMLFPSQAPTTVAVQMSFGCEPISNGWRLTSYNVTSGGSGSGLATDYALYFAIVRRP